MRLRAGAGRGRDGRGRRLEVELDDAPHEDTVHDDARHDDTVPDDTVPDHAVPGPTPARTPTPDAHRPPSRWRRWWPALPVAVVVALVAAQGLADARERTRIAALTTVPGVVEPLDGAAEVAWEVDATTSLSTAVRAGPVVVTPTVAVDHRVTLEGRDTATGAARWTVEAVAARPAWGEEAWSEPPACAAVPDRPGQVVCVVGDGGERLVDGGWTPVPATSTRLLLLDAADGAVLVEREVPPPVSSVTVVGADVVLAGQADGTLRVRSQGLLDGAARWSTTVPLRDDALLPTGGAAVTLLDPRTLAVDLGSAVTLVSTDGEVLRTVEAAPLDGLTGQVVETTVVTSTTLGAVAVGNRGGTVVGTAAGVVDLEGSPLPVVVDDGSVPGLVLTRTPALQAWDAGDGSPRWDARIVDAQDATVLGGRVHVGTSSAVVTLDGRTGAELWRTRRPSATGTPVTDGRYLYVLAAQDGRHSRPYDLAALHLADGSEAWRSPLADGIGVVGVAGLLVTSGFDASTNRSVLQVLR